MTRDELALRSRIFATFARGGRPPTLPDSPELRALAEQHVVVLDDDGGVVMAHPFGVERAGATRVEALAGTWFGNCAWGGLGIVAALGLGDAVVTSRGISTDEAAAFHVAVPARQWWDDIGFT